MEETPGSNLGIQMSSREKIAKCCITTTYREGHKCSIAKSTRGWVDIEVQQCQADGTGHHHGPEEVWHCGPLAPVGPNAGTSEVQCRIAWHGHEPLPVGTEEGIARCRPQCPCSYAPYSQEEVVAKAQCKHEYQVANGSQSPGPPGACQLGRSIKKKEGKEEKTRKTTKEKPITTTTTTNTSRLTKTQEVPILTLSAARVKKKFP
ncbi:hypothetical protein E2C01_024997 [Portunus trituberculatus]|uniref:Uncharacterized protein n=1 Tax=Portunus trituberculatus TaxID=210409 RepID=A0A5B7EC62_PORTR|nr:hypothetical protein [Portunus trituberculatus]